MNICNMRRWIVPAMLTAAVCMSADNIVLLHTNDTHSAIDPDANGAGGVLQRKAVIDSVRRAEKNTVVIDAGDMVQGSLYFKFFRGDVEYPLMNMTGYDIRILGNHEFDNGLDELAKYYKDVKGARLSANYDFTDTPLKGMFKPYVIKNIAGKKVGFFGINVNPEGLITRSNYGDLKFKDIIETANETARELKHDKKCDLVVMVSHIGVNPEDEGATDYDVARASRDIDIIIGGHSHTLITPDGVPNPSRIKNAEGKDVVVGQTGKYGKYIGEMKIDTDKIGTPEAITYELIPVTDRFPDSQLDQKMKKFIEPYRHVVDSVNSHPIAISKYDLNSDDRNGGYANWAADYAQWYGSLKLDSLTPGRRLDIGLMNVGGIRQNMPAGNVTEGQMLSTFPFANRMVISEVKGRDFIDAMKAAWVKGGEGISENVRVVTDGPEVVRVVIDGQEMDPEKTYTICTIDYLAQGNDKLTSLANGKVIWTDDEDMAVPMMRYIHHLTDLGLPIAPDMTGRFQQQVKLK